MQVQNGSGLPGRERELKYTEQASRVVGPDLEGGGGLPAARLCGSENERGCAVAHRGSSGEILATVSRVDAIIILEYNHNYPRPLKTAHQDATRAMASQASGCRVLRRNGRRPRTTAGTSHAHQHESASRSQVSGPAVRDQSGGSVKSCPMRLDADSTASPLPLIAVTLNNVEQARSQALIMVRGSRNDTVVTPSRWNVAQFGLAGARPRARLVMAAITGGGSGLSAGPWRAIASDRSRVSPLRGCAHTRWST